MNRTDVLQILKQPKNAGLLKQAQSHEDWLNVYASGLKKSILLDSFAQLFVPELRTLIFDHFEVHSRPVLAPSTGTVFTHYNKVNETVEGLQTDYIVGKPAELLSMVAYLNHAYLSEPGRANGLSAAVFFGKRILEAILYRPNSRILIDFPAEPQAIMPYVNVVCVDEIYDIDEDHTGCRYLIVRRSETLPDNTKRDRFYFYGPENYQLWERNGYGRFVQLSETPHTFGRTPVRAVSDFLMHSGAYILRKSPISDSLPDLYNYNLLVNMAKVFNWRNGLPLHFGVKAACKEVHPIHGVPCQEGYFVFDGEHSEDGLPRLQREKCPACARKTQEQMRFGRTIDIDVDDLMSRPEMANAIRTITGYVGTDRDLLIYNDEKVEQLRLKIEADIIGFAFKATQSREALNELQVRDNNEEKQNSLANIAERLERLQEWTERLMGSILAESFMDVKVWYGRSFYLKTPADHQKEYEDFVKAGADDFVLNQKLREVFQAQYRYDPELIEAYRYIAAIIPMRHVPTKDLLIHSQKMQTGNPAIQRDLFFRLNAAAWIEEFMLFQYKKIFGLAYTPEAKFNRMKAWFERKLTEAMPPPQPVQGLPMPEQDPINSPSN